MMGTREEVRGDDQLVGRGGTPAGLDQTLAGEPGRQPRSGRSRKAGRTDGRTDGGGGRDGTDGRRIVHPTPENTPNAG